eukprot:5369022-Amphidinium_carterae.1
MFARFGRHFRACFVVVLPAAFQFVWHRGTLSVCDLQLDPPTHSRCYIQLWKLCIMLCIEMRPLVECGTTTLLVRAFLLCDNFLHEVWKQVVVSSTQETAPRVVIIPHSSSSSLLRGQNSLYIVTDMTSRKYSIKLECCYQGTRNKQ